MLEHRRGKVYKHKDGRYPDNNDVEVVVAVQTNVSAASVFLLLYVFIEVVASWHSSCEAFDLSTALLISSTSYLDIF